LPSGSIEVTWLLLAVALALLPFFQFFRGTPHQLAAVKELEESVPKELLEEDAAWFEAWKASGIDQEIYMSKYFKQLDNFSGQGYRECFSSAAAMVASFWGKVKTDDEYNLHREKFGDTTSVQAQLDALKALGLDAEFRQDGDADMIELEIENGRPVLVGWLHQGDLLQGEPPMCSSTCGHWSVITGYAGKHSSDPEWVMFDPAGYPDMVGGGHEESLSGRRVRVRQSAFYQRWQVDGPKTGWVILVDG
jgi:hypothetical protein